MQREAYQSHTNAKLGGRPEREEGGCSSGGQGERTGTQALTRTAGSREGRGSRGQVTWGAGPADIESILHLHPPIVTAMLRDWGLFPFVVEENYFMCPRNHECELCRAQKRL